MAKFTIKKEGYIKYQLTTWQGVVEMDGEEVEGEEEEKVITITLGQLKDILAPYQADEEGAEDAEGTDGAESQLEFSLAEVDKTRLVPVIDFKGRKS